MHEHIFLLVCVFFCQPLCVCVSLLLCNMFARRLFVFTYTHTFKSAHVCVREATPERGVVCAVVAYTQLPVCAPGVLCEFSLVVSLCVFLYIQKKLRKTYIASILYDYSNSDSACDTGFTHRKRNPNKRKCVIALSLHCFFVLFYSQNKHSPALFPCSLVSPHKTSQTYGFG